jgi:hypothetical protein
MATPPHLSPPPAPNRGQYDRHERDEFVAAIERARLPPPGGATSVRRSVAPMVRSRG